MLDLQLMHIDARRQFSTNEWRSHKTMLVGFLLVTLGTLILAIVGLAFVEPLRALGWGSVLR